MRSWQSPVVPRLAASGERPRVFDTASRTLRPVGDAQTGAARMYVCGITPYDATHMGHAFTYVTFDLLNRIWRAAGLDVRYVQNITDVDDPLLERATATGVDWTELATGQIDLFRADMEALRVLPPDEYIAVTEFIDPVVELIERLAAEGSVYQLDDPEYPDWYFRCRHGGGIGTISHLSEDEALAVFAERGGDPERPGKADPLDCLVWRLERPGEPSWDSTLGRGRPGWHVECTAISLQHLGPRFDVQGGGSDLAFPHHEMCAAQAVAATGEPLAEAFVHSGMVGLDGEKMSKSLGNLVLVSTLRAEGSDPMALRLALLAHHYRADWFWTSADLAAAEVRLDRWRRAAARPAGEAADATVSEIGAALCADLDAPAALAAVDAWAERTLNGVGSVPGAPADVARAVDALLGVDLNPAV
ncbi:cysteine--1-D-myo-inosityl 2-amino-2-deoxy-alpha-D-glucopyranoside ligase [Propionicicella superfundia]|uniref:cysteine--1-D-myo-inosityl 2-amino-2-deoxy-alpha-D-glucopyranoside ligase n=1 Tax=Propionicicella superfundia TaxID=348582 RepID=UPI00042616DA|nr:cysteine--1-D-myo-inosityl 2-amino-2-deoxy-alpha-D-glucopyranoside ligase [Propionicicella superfundia]